jgi:hypothetical protein
MRTLRTMNVPMLVYRNGNERASTAQLVAELAATPDLRTLEHARDLLVDFGEFESAVVDAHCPDVDTWDALTCALRLAARRVAELWYRAFVRHPRELADAGEVEAIRAQLRELTALPLPREVSRRAAEGYAYYAVYPEQYARAAELLCGQLCPRSVLVVGLRSIGTSLSSAVEEAIRARGIRVRSMTVRPRGHPFERELRLSARLEEELRNAASTDLIAIVDEGPGLSGSSLAAVARSVRSLGAPPSRVVLLPGHEVDPGKLGSSRARRVFQEHRRFVGSFDPASAVTASHARVEDASAGRWRPLLRRGEADPPVQPQHERRKLFFYGDGSLPVSHVRFAGLGRHGLRAARRAERLGNAGFGPRVEGFKDGYLSLRFVEGRPLERGSITPRVLETLGAYAAWTHRSFPSKASMDRGALLEMTTANVRESLGEAALDSHGRALEAWAWSLPDEATEVDGRLQPHEWIAAPRGLVKVDGTDHGRDHFYPGPTDIAWDLAGAIAEFSLDAGAQFALLESFARCAGDRHVERRLPFYLVTYLAYRAGYAALASDTLGDTPDGLGFRALKTRYTELLPGALERLSQCSPA